MAATSRYKEHLQVDSSPDLSRPEGTEVRFSRSASKGEAIEIGTSVLMRIRGRRTRPHAIPNLLSLKETQLLGLETG